MSLIKKTFLFICFFSLVSACTKREPEFSTVLDDPKPLSDFSLNRENGAGFNLESLKDKWSVLFFGYTHCPDVCPLTLYQLAENVIGITGNIEELRKLTDQLGIFFKANKHEGENYSVNHSAAVVVINEEAQFHAVFSAPHSIEQFVSDLPIIIKGS